MHAVDPAARRLWRAGPGPRKRDLVKRVIKLFLWTPILAIAAFAQQPKIHLVHLDPQPGIDGGCPAVVHFSGHIETTGPLKVTYSWVRSDGSRTDHTLNFPKAMRRDINTIWRISKSYRGWMQLVILSPQHMQTARANFSVNCGK
jgi:hypothetical protein